MRKISKKRILDLMYEHNKEEVDRGIEKKSVTPLEFLEEDYGLHVFEILEFITKPKILSKAILWEWLNDNVTTLIIELLYKEEYLEENCSKEDVWDFLNTTSKTEIYFRWGHKLEDLLKEKFHYFLDDFLKMKQARLDFKKYGNKYIEKDWSYGNDWSSSIVDFCGMPGFKEFLISTELTALDMYEQLLLLLKRKEKNEISST